MPTCWQPQSTAPAALKALLGACRPPLLSTLTLRSARGVPRRCAGCAARSHVTVQPPGTVMCRRQSPRNSRPPPLAASGRSKPCEWCTGDLRKARPRRCLAPKAWSPQDGRDPRLRPSEREGQRRHGDGVGRAECDERAPNSAWVAKRATLSPLHEPCPLVPRRLRRLVRLQPPGEVWCRQPLAAARRLLP